MKKLLTQVKQDMEAIVNEWIALDVLKKDTVFVIGCSTSEIAGEHIGTSGSEEIAAILFDNLQALANQTGVHIAFQGCEHINRAIVMEDATRKMLGLDEVSVVPHPKAGGSMASYAYKHFDQAVVVEEVTASAGMDIGDTLIGMHVKRVAVPLRLKQTVIGAAHITAARTRPKLIGGERAHYQ